MRIHVASHPRQYLVFSVFLIITILVGVQCYLSEVLFCIFLMTNVSFYDLISHLYIFFLCSTCSHGWPFFFFKVGCLSFYCRVVVLYVFWIQVFFHMYC